MFCIECGSEIASGAAFCPICGARILKPSEGRSLQQGGRMPQTAERTGQQWPEAAAMPPAQNTQAPIPMQNQGYGQGAQYGWDPNGQQGAQYGWNPNGQQGAQYGWNPNGQQAAQYNQGSGCYVPQRNLRTNRALWKFILFSSLTFGIYGIISMTTVGNDINRIATPYDRRNTMNFCLVFFLFSWLTVGILPLVWGANLSGRIGRELKRRRIHYSFGKKTFWLWCILGSLIFCGPFIYLHKLFVSMNLLSGDYNCRG